MQLYTQSQFNFVLPHSTKDSPYHEPHAAKTAPSPAPRARSKRGRKRAGSTVVTSETSHPTSRNAYVETRAWLLKEHGPVCAYCGVRFTAKVMTLDHVAPRRGQTAFDRRDNLVLACPGCNMLKRDQTPMAFLLGNRTRAENLARYGAHLSPMLVDLAKSLAPALAFDDDDDGESPYRD